MDIAQNTGIKRGVGSCRDCFRLLFQLLVPSIAGLLVLAPHLRASDRSLQVTGNLVGSVVDALGTPQLGATVQVLNKYDRVVSKTITSADGSFSFSGLQADLYSIRVSLASFLPASRDKIPVKAGLDSVLQIRLATLFSNVELSYTIPTAPMSDDWRWVLRSSPATRPINRVLSLGLPGSSSNDDLGRVPLFSETHARLMLSGGDSNLLNPDFGTSDLGTGFSLSTNILGKNLLQLGGSMGQVASVGPSAIGLFAVYSRNESGSSGAPPEVVFSFAQLGGIGPQLLGNQALPSANAFSASPVVRMMSLSTYDTLDIASTFHLEYGVIAESVDYLQHRGRLTPFGRFSVDLGTGSELIASYSNGGRPDPLLSHQSSLSVADLDNDRRGQAGSISSLARLPQLSDENGRLELQRTQTYEIGVRKIDGSLSYAVSAFYDDIVNGRLNVAGDTSLVNGNDLLWDGTSTTSIYNIGSYRSSGYLASVDQRFNPSLDMELAYGRMSGFSPDSAGMIRDPASQRPFLEESNHDVAVATVNAHVPGVKTRLSASYGLVAGHTVIPAHAFTTQAVNIAPGLNICVRQPLPSFPGIPGHFELTADLRNLFGQGYLPIVATGGQTLLIVQSPRALRGGLNFTF